MASKRSDQIKVLYNGWVNTIIENPGMSIEETRDLFEHWGDVTGEPGGIDYAEIDASGIKSMWVKPKNSNKDKVILCLHGGGYSGGSMYSHRKLFGHIAKAVGCSALIVHYRRTPESIHPGPVNDCVTTYEWLLDQGYKPENIAITGDSAGGALAITTMLAARDKGLPLPAASMPISPWVDMEALGETLDTNAHKDCFVKRFLVEHMVDVFLGESGSKKDPLANPLYADLSGLPPLFIQVGGDEALLDDSRRIVKLAKYAGVDVRFQIYPEMQHVFHFLVGNAPEGDQAVQDMADWVRPKLGLA